MTVNQSVSGQLSVLVSQPGGSYVTLIPNVSSSSVSTATTQRLLHLFLLSYPLLSLQLFCHLSGLRVCC